MVYSLVTNPIKQVMHFGVECVIPRNPFIASVSGFVGWYTHRRTQEWSHSYLKNIFMEQMGCKETNYTINGVFTNITDIVIKNIGSSVTGYIDSWTGFNTASWVTDAVGNVTSNNVLLEQCSEGIRCVGADLSTPFFTPEIAPYVEYYYALGAMIATSIALNLIAITLLKLHSVGTGCCQSRREEEQCLYDPVPLQSPPPLTQQPNPIESQLALVELQLKQVQESQGRDQALIQSFQEKWGEIISSIEGHTTPILEKVMQIENMVSDQTRKKGAVYNEEDIDRILYQRRKERDEDLLYKIMFSWWIDKICPGPTDDLP